MTSASVAEQCNIELIQIPPGCTDECQPLDRRVFGSLKQQARAHTSKEIGKILFNSMDPTTPDLQYKPQTKQDSVQLLINIWDNFSTSQIEKAWSLALNGRENGENEDV